MRDGNPNRSHNGTGSVSSASAPLSFKSRKIVHITRRSQRELSFAPHGVVPPTDGYTGTILPISSVVNSASSPVALASGRISKVGWTILNFVDPGGEFSAFPLREPSSFP